MPRANIAAISAVPIAGMLMLGFGATAQASELQGATDLCKRASERPTIISACSVVIGLSHDPKLLERAFNRRGMAEEQVGQFDLAASDYSNVIRINPTIAGYFDNRMRAYKGAGRLDLALQDANTAVSMAPGYAFTLHGRGAVYFDQGDYRAAVRDFSTALSINPRDASIHVDRGRALVRTGDVEAALRDFEAARAINPANEPALRERGMAYAQLGRAAEAKSDLSAAVAIAPADDDAAKALRQLEMTASSQPANGKPNRAGDDGGSIVSTSDSFTPPSGAPFCTEKDELQEYVLAALKKDQKWMSQLKSCAFVKGGLKIALIDAGDPVRGMHVDKVRIFGNDGSMVGYTLTIDKDGS